MLSLLCTPCLVPATLLLLHGLSPTWQAANEVKCSGNGLQHFSYAWQKAPNESVSQVSTVSAKMPKLQCWIKSSVDQTAAGDWLCTDQAVHQSVRWPFPAVRTDWDAWGLVNNNPWLVFARCTHSMQLELVPKEFRPDYTSHGKHGQ